MISHSRNLRKKLGWKCVLGIRDTIMLPLLQNPQKSLPAFGRVVTPGGHPPTPPPRLTAGEGRGGRGHSVPRCKGIWVCLVTVSSSQNTEAHKDCATDTCSSRFQRQLVFPEVLFSEYKSWENFLRGFHGEKALGNTGELLFLENNQAVCSVSHV